MTATKKKLKVSGKNGVNLGDFDNSFLSFQQERFHDIIILVWRHSYPPSQVFPG